MANFIKAIHKKIPKNFRFFSNKTKNMEKLQLYNEKLSKSLKVAKQTFEKLPLATQDRVMRTDDLATVLKIIPDHYQKMPNFKFLLYFIWSVLKESDEDFSVDLISIENISTKLKVIEGITSGFIGSPDWRYSFIGGNFDEYDRLAPENVISPWHDVGLVITAAEETSFVEEGQTCLQMVVTTPKGSQSLSRIVKDERMNPIRHYINPSNGIAIKFDGRNPFNFGFMPQTWGDPREKCSVSDLYYYDDILWAFDITGTGNAIGTSMVKLLGCIGLVEEESERILWVVVCSSVNCEVTNDLSDIMDLNTWLPGCLEKLKSNLIQISNKIVGKCSIFKNKFFDKKTAIEIIKLANLSWSFLIKKAIPPSKTYYLHHPLIRNNELMRIEEKVDESTRLEHAMGLTLEQRLKKEWTELKQKEAFFRNQHLQNSLQRAKQQNHFLLKSIKKLAPEAIPAIEQKLRLAEKLFPLPSETGMEMVFGKREAEERESIRKALEMAQKAKGGQMSERGGLLGDEIKDGFHGEIEDSSGEEVFEGLEGPDRDERFKADLQKALEKRLKAKMLNLE